ncbi:hypothetical protein [Stutzerimonas kunmingensis]|uniref:hypothetical protein n=1 Tax=Stutzerimonas kunmingensis TaxID=1211807 RepID=UPI00210661C3|nr:hypothetical protein [Stutzerimonas kunmingensis]MCQ2034447.1 hypothetical protein [Stutzerimonas kunmingensis]
MKLMVLSWLAGLAGFGLLVAGVALLNIPAALMVAGGGLLGWSYLADRAAAKLNEKGG